MLDHAIYLSVILAQFVWGAISIHQSRRIRELEKEVDL